MKHSIEREARAGIETYLSDSEEEFQENQRQDLLDSEEAAKIEDERAMADRRMMLQGFDPATGERYTPTQFREILRHMELTPEERRDVFQRLSMQHDFEVDFLEDEKDRAWYEYRGIDRDDVWKALDDDAYEERYGNQIRELSGLPSTIALTN